MGGTTLETHKAPSEKKEFFFVNPKPFDVPRLLRAVVRGGDGDKEAEEGRFRGKQDWDQTTGNPEG